MAFTESSVPAEEVQETVNVKPKENPTTAEVINKVSRSSFRCVLERVEEIEKALDHFEKRLKEDQGCINELGYCFPIQQRSSDYGGSSEAELDAANAAFMLDNGNGLLPFIKKCLRNEAKYFTIIRWTNEKENEFKIVDPDRFASMYGSEKRKDGMTKRKLTRSLAYLVNSKRRLKRSTSRTFVYRILTASKEELRSCETSPSNSYLFSPVPSIYNVDEESDDFGESQKTTNANENSQSNMEKLKKLVRKNPHLIQTMIDIQNNKQQQQERLQQQQQQHQQEQNQQQKQQREPDAGELTPTFRMKGSKRSYKEIFSSFDTSSPLSSIFTNVKMQKMEPFNDLNASSFSQNVFFAGEANNSFPQSPSGSHSTLCSPESFVSSEYENAMNYYKPSPPSETPSLCDVDVKENASTYLEQVLSCQQLTGQLPQQMPATTNILNPIQPWPENLAYINPTFCATEPTNTITDLSAYFF